MIPPKLQAFGARLISSGILVAALFALLAVQTVRLEGLKIWPLKIEGYIAKAERHKAAAQSCETRHAVTRQSVELLERTVNEMNREAEARAKAYQDARNLAAQRAKELARLERSTDATIARLRAISAQPSSGRCETSSAIREALEGL